MRSARKVLNLEQLYIVCHGEGTPWQLGDGIAAVPAGSLDACVADCRIVAPFCHPHGSDLLMIAIATYLNMVSAQ